MHKLKYREVHQEDLYLLNPKHPQKLIYQYMLLLSPSLQIEAF